MAMTEIHSGVKQTSDYSCGAACCLFILRMLEVEKMGGQTVDNIMKKTSTFGSLVLVGSTPQNVARYVEHRCKQAQRGVTIRRLGGSTPISRAWLHTLTPAISGYAKFMGNPGVDDVILRFIVPKSFDLTAHFVVQTHFGTLGSKIMDPYTGTIEIMPFDDFLTHGSSEEYQSTGLDLVISG